jgi:hypothetical protein
VDTLLNTLCYIGTLQDSRWDTQVHSWRTRVHLRIIADGIKTFPCQSRFPAPFHVLLFRGCHACIPRNNIPSQFGTQALSVTFQPRNGPGYKNAFTFVNITWVSAVEESWN